MAATIRRVAFWLVVVAVPLLLLFVAASVWVYRQALMSNEGELDFANPLAIPPLLEPTIDEAGRKVFDLVAQEGESSFLPGTSTRTRGLNGAYLGPTLRAARGDEVVVRVANELPEATTLHWHGMALPGAMDGGPHQLIAPGSVWEPYWEIEQPAATLWYHAHPHGSTATHVYRGLAGLFLVDDAESSSLALPSTYGVDDIPLVVQDKRFGGDGQLRQGGNFGTVLGILGDEILVNGTHDPHVEVTDELVRFRLLNGSNGRVYDFAFEDDRPFSVVAGDSGLIASPVERRRLSLSPGERAEIVVRFEPGDEVVLESRGADLGMGFPMDRLNGAHDRFDIVQVRAADELRPSPSLPATLVEVERIDETDSRRTRTFDLGEFQTINGLEMNMGRIDARVPAGDVEVWEVDNPSGTYHNFHVHLVHFLVLDIDGSPPPPEFAGWKDTVQLPPGSRARLVARFMADPDPNAPFMFHCHILVHEDAGMMGQFTIVDGEGTSPGSG